MEKEQIKAEVKRMRAAGVNPAEIEAFVDRALEERKAAIQQQIAGANAQTWSNNLGAAKEAVAMPRKDVGPPMSFDQAMSEAGQRDPNSLDRTAREADLVMRHPEHGKPLRAMQEANSAVRGLGAGIGAGAVMGPLAGSLIGRTAPLQRMGVAAAEGAAGGAAEGYASADEAGKSGRDVAGDTGAGFLLGGAIGGSLQGLGEAYKAAARKGPYTNRVMEMDEAGRLEDVMARYKAAGGADEALQAEARAGRRGIEAGRDARLQAARSAQAEARAAEGGALATVRPLKGKLKQLREANRHQYADELDSTLERDLSGFEERLVIPGAEAERKVRRLPQARAVAAGKLDEGKRIHDEAARAVPRKVEEVREQIFRRINELDNAAQRTPPGPLRDSIEKQIEDIESNMDLHLGKVKQKAREEIPTVWTPEAKTAVDRVKSYESAKDSLPRVETLLAERKLLDSELSALSGPNLDPSQKARRRHLGQLRADLNEAIHAASDAAGGKITAADKQFADAKTAETVMDDFLRGPEKELIREGQGEGAIASNLRPLNQELSAERRLIDAGDIGNRKGIELMERAEALAKEYPEVREALERIRDMSAHSATTYGLPTFARGNLAGNVAALVSKNAKALGRTLYETGKAFPKDIATVTATDELTPELREMIFNWMRTAAPTERKNR